MLHRVLRAVHTVVAPGRFVPPNPEHERTEVAMSSDDLRQTKREDAVTSLQPLFKEGPSRGIGYDFDVNQLSYCVVKSHYFNVFI